MSLIQAKSSCHQEIEEGRWESSCRIEALKLWEKTAGQEHFLEDALRPQTDEKRHRRRNTILLPCPLIFYLPRNIS